MATTYFEPRSSRRELVYRATRVLDYLFGVLYALFGIRLVLELLGARRGAGFVQFIDAVTNPFYAPFRGILPSETVDGSHPIVWPLVVALVAYVLLQAAIHGLLRLALRD